MTDEGIEVDDDWQRIPRDAPVISLRAPEGIEEEWPCNCHPADKRPTAMMVELGNRSSSATTRLCAEGVGLLLLQVANWTAP